MKHLKDSFYGVVFRTCRGIVRRLYPTYKVQLPSNLKGPIVYITHHQNFFGPFIVLLWFTRNVHAWILYVFLKGKSCYQQYVNYTFTKRLGWNPTLAKLCAYPISFFMAKLLNSCRGIPVYRGSRKIIETFKQSIVSLGNGESLVIFPDTEYSDNSPEIKAMYEGFLSLEQYYLKATGEHLCFVPLYVSKQKRTIVANQVIYFRDGKLFKEEKKIVYDKIQAELNRLAVACGDSKQVERN